MKALLARWLPGPAARIRAGGAVILVLLLALLQAPWTERLQAAWFDAHQMLMPRRPSAPLGPVVVVEIDQQSLRALGQWPWPRTELARLVRTLQAAHPAAIGLDILMPEADALSPERLLAEPVGRDPAVAAALRDMPANDDVLAESLAAAPTVLAVAGSPTATGSALRATPVMLRDLGGSATPVGVASLALPHYAAVVRSIEALDRRAAGHGLVSLTNTRGVVRRLPLLVSINGTPVPGLALEMVRVAEGAAALRATVSGPHVVSVQAGRLLVPTEPDGAVRPYFSGVRAEASVSAIDVLQGRVTPDRLQGRHVLVGLTALALEDLHDTPLGDGVSGVLIHAQALENLLEGTLLRRPSWAPLVEWLLLLVLGGWTVWAAPRTSPVSGLMALAGAVLLPIGGGLLAFRYGRLLIDTASPALSLLVLGAGLLALSLAESIHQRQQLQAQVQAQREDSARMGGELQAAQRIQTASLPRGDLLRGDPRVQLKAAMTPAREVGGDLYDYFMLDERRLFMMIGDVAGKGLSASIFMAVSKALVKSAMLRMPGTDLGVLLATANAEISRDNPEMLFVTLYVAVLDLESGLLSYCNAGHDNPLVLRPPAAVIHRIEDGDGPPLCTLAGYAYQGASRQLHPGEMLCLLTDGVMDAQDAAGHRYGLDRALQVVAQASLQQCTAAELVQALHGSVLAFAAGAEPADDLTILALRWQGPPAAATAA